MIVCNNCGAVIARDEKACAECGNENTAAAQAQVSANRVLAEQRLTAPQSSSSRTFSTAAVVIGAFLFLTIGVVSARFLLSGDQRNQKDGSLTSTSPPTTTSRLPDPQSTPSQTYSSRVKLPPADNTQAVSEVVETLNEWAAASRAHDLNGHMNYYAETLDTYFSKRNVSAAYVRGSKTPAFTRYHTLDIQLRNIQVNPDSSGMRATAILDKTFRFEGDKVLSGSVQQIISLSKATGRWQITGERDLRVYYINK